ncbi:MULTISPECIES: hypothetical protein [Burkholderia cepacia complex]|uniref:hypothetical protein n=1 Tax=Burkholderia cepacia complex TaxID=87882 RepID=UPI0013DD9AC9|nr:MULTISPECIES: hypothetical protein [Burkholderia cepacia complex]
METIAICPPVSELGRVPALKHIVFSPEANIDERKEALGLRSTVWRGPRRVVHETYFDLLNQAITNRRFFLNEINAPTRRARL